jgi:hypothetical protein
MAATNCTANTSRRHQFAFSNSGSTTLANRIAALGFGLRSTTNYAKDEGVNGQIHSRTEDYAIDKTMVSGPVSFNVRPSDMRWCLPLILGTAFSTNTIKAGAACPFFRVGHLDSVIDILYTYFDCIVSKATFSSSDAMGGLLMLAMDIESKQSTQTASSGWPAGMNLATQQPLTHSLSTLTINGNTRRIKDASIVIDNQLMTDQFFNARYREDFPSDGQMITLTHTSPFDDANDLAFTNLTGSVAATLVYTAPNLSMTFTFPALRFIAPEPEVGGKGSRVTNQYTWEACLAAGAVLGTDSAMTVTLDDTV